ncbi:cobalt-precorrin-6A reductase [Pelagovum pacificum]|uniref:Cobalt-precorrin-6A reductase n=1 Tax=Pelagovum pacificum TaxID=2588711 RepID=A0A5C5GEE4_9RHOB|nr:cobalt-precorrin-6A reductase [Pelagovum pacificum]QQA44576.1 cobalt-precorrin-6A reductase [Pelagovum pacificum]TNY32311.1 cobalt-precorrin-6A reductase [Pelagovum pacificum]
MTLLLLGGTAEARQLAERLAAARVPAVLSFAGVTRHPVTTGLPTRTGGFGGAAGFAEYLGRNAISAVIDATHPFAARIGRRTKELCDLEGLPYLRLLRPEWRAGDGDDWHLIDRAEEAAGLIPDGATVLLAVGPGSLAGFANLEGRRIFCRRIDPPLEPFPIAGGDWIVGRPTATVADEAKTMTDRGIDWVVTKNSGGADGYGKLQAARKLSIPVVLLRRPAGYPCERVETADEAFAWAIRR